MNKHKICRIVTTYGHWDYIRRWVFDDRLVQPHVTWIFVNDKPEDIVPDDMRERIASMGFLIEPKVNMGRCCARNLGIFTARSEWVDIVDGDDLPFPIDNTFDKGHEAAGLIYFNVVHHFTRGRHIITEEVGDWQPPQLNKVIKATVGNWDPRPAATLWRRSVVRELGGYDGRFDYVEDFNLAIRAKLAGVRHSFNSATKASYQRSTPGRPTSPICALACLKNLELARLLVSDEYKEAVEEQIRFYRKALLWAGMKEINKSNPSFIIKLWETTKWLTGKI